VKTGSLFNARGVQLVDVPAGNTRFVRLTIGSAQSGSRIRIEEAWLGGNHA
jgi:alpha-L-fucosidase